MYLETLIQEENVTKIEIIDKYGATIVCDVSHIEGYRYEVVTNVAEAIAYLEKEGVTIKNIK